MRPFLLLVGAIILWQYVAIIGDDFTWSIYRPTDGIDTLTEISRSFFNWIGGLWAHLCSFWHQINLEDFMTSIYELGRSIFFLSVSWIIMPDYYFEIRATYAEDRFLVDAGAITILGLLIGIRNFPFYPELVKGLCMQAFLTTLLLIRTQCLNSDLVAAITCLEQL